MGHTTRMDHTPLAAALADHLREQGTPEHISRLFAQVPRHRFLPDLMWGEDRTRYDRTTDPEAWMAAAYSDQPLTTQRDDGTEGGRGIASSSSSAPSVMARMLVAAEIEPAHQVLEVGTGTGYNAALLSRMLGGGQVTTVEIDGTLAETARSALYTEGHYPTVIVGDGEQVGAGRPNFDRIIATCTVAQIPSTWMVQMRGRGKIVTPWAPTPGAPGGVLAALDTTGHGVAHGRFEGGLSFMWARGQRWPDQPAPRPHALAHQVDQTTTDPREPFLDGDQALILSLLMPSWSYGMRVAPDAEDPHVWLASTRCSSWARLHADGRVEQFGARMIATEADNAMRWWQSKGRPAVSEFGLTVDLDHGIQTVWTHGPEHALWSTHR